MCCAVLREARTMMEMLGMAKKFPRADNNIRVMSSFSCAYDDMETGAGLFIKEHHYYLYYLLIVICKVATSHHALS